ncbi:MAG: TolC family protein [Bacteroides sp.]|uniref:TolC family protein n=1 Tax=Bacteroides sp. TaxID=29523 RepID=UPI002FCB3874
MKRILFFLPYFLFVYEVYGQITLEHCLRKAQENYPLMQQYDLIQQAKEYNLDNASKGYLPQFALSAKASYQSEVTEFPVTIPGVNIKALPKEQYQVMLELRQNLWDGGEIRKAKAEMKAASEVDRERLAVDMYTLNERVDQLYFGTLLLGEQLNQNQLLQDDLERNLKQIAAYVTNGVANQSDLDAVQVNLLDARQKRIELTATRVAYLQMLSLMIGEELAPDVTLIKPLDAGSGSNEQQILRPELNWFAAQERRLQVQKEALVVRSLPHLGLFVQGAYGNPGLNMLKNESSPFYIAGVRLFWNFGSLYTLRNDKRLIETNRLQVQNNQEVFLFNTQLQVTQQNNAIASMRKQMQDDNEIIRLRTNIRQAAEVKVANGTLTVTEMLREITAENMARQTKALHEIQLLMNIRKLNYITNH